MRRLRGGGRVRTRSYRPLTQRELGGDLEECGFHGYCVSCAASIVRGSPVFRMTTQLLRNHGDSWKARWGHWNGRMATSDGSRPDSCRSVR
jgi:hypothetical protein